jgi:hypothetical protein
MSSSRHFALLLALGLAATAAALAQSSNSSSNPADSAPDASQTLAQAEQPATQFQAQEQSQGQMSVEARIRARREQRRATALHQAYDHTYEAYAGMGYLRFVPGAGTPASTSPAVPHGPGLEHATEYAWDIGVTRFLNQRLGVTVDGRGYYGTAYVYNNSQTNSAITNPAISQIAVLAGPAYRFYMQPKYSISGRVLGGVAHGNFSSDTNHNEALSTSLGLWPDGNTFAASVGIVGEYNLTPNVALRIIPEYFLTGFGSTTQNSLGFTLGIGYRFGKQ